ncbi:MAG: TraB/GumN family protein [Pseudomonadales bacterium]
MALVLPAAAATAATAAPAAAPGVDVQAYEQLPGPKALAVAVDRPQIRGIAHSQPNDLAAALAALQACEAERRGIGESCEIKRLNTEAVTTGAEIRADLPPGPHALYLWRYQGERAVVYLAGSIHVLKPSLYPLPAQYDAAFAGSDQLVVEVDVSRYAPAELQQRAARYIQLNPQGTTLQSVLPAPLYRRLVSRLSSYGMSEASVTGMKPGFLMNQLVIARLFSLGYLQEYGVEQHFLQQRGQRKVLELETLDTQLRLLYDQPMPTQIQLLADTLDQEPEVEAIIADMLRAWLSGDDARLLALFEEQSGTSELSRAFTRQLLDDRNIGMAQTIRGYLQGSGTYFVLIGAAHFVGEKGIISLLDRQGIRGRRITTDTPLSILNPGAN